MRNAIRLENPKYGIYQRLNCVITDRGLHASQKSIVKDLVSDVTQAWERTGNERERWESVSCDFLPCYL